MLGERIRELRQGLRLTQEDLAKQIRVGILQINRYENNKSEPKAEILARLAEHLYTSTDYLLGLTEDATPARFTRTELQPKERAVVAALRRGDDRGAIRVIVADE